MSGDWSPISAAPRDGTPVILWMAQDEAVPFVPLSVGFWTISAATGAGYWWIFGDPPLLCSDREIRGWKPLLRG